MHLSTFSLYKDYSSTSSHYVAPMAQSIFPSLDKDVELPERSSLSSQCPICIITTYYLITLVVHSWLAKHKNTNPTKVLGAKNAVTYIYDTVKYDSITHSLSHSHDAQYSHQISPLTSTSNLLLNDTIVNYQYPLPYESHIISNYSKKY